MAIDSTRGAGGLPRRVVSDLLADERRRRALECLDAADGPLTVAELARRVAGEEAGEPPGAVPGGRVAALETDLYETHIPKLTATGVVEYDSTLATVRLTPTADAVREAL